MKKIVLFATLIVAVSLTSYARKLVAEGKTYSAFGNYKIMTDNKSVWINGKEHQPLVITYENSDLVVRVAIDMDRQGKKYYVLSDNLSVQYVSNRHYFGVEKLDKGIEKDGFRTSDAALNRVEYFHQKAITSGYSWRRDNTKLIAAYFPMLLNNVENLVAAK
jgi:hypothetical protein